MSHEKRRWLYRAFSPVSRATRSWRSYTFGCLQVYQIPRLLAGFRAFRSPPQPGQSAAQAGELMQPSATPKIALAVVLIPATLALAAALIIQALPGLIELLLARINPPPRPE
jgi:hypothetical protein